MRRQGPIWLMIAVLLTAVYLTVFYVDETERALVFQFGEPLGDPVKPGFHIKVPIIHKVARFDNRLLHYDVPQLEILTADKKSMMVDCHAKWEITDPLKYYVTVRTRENAELTIRDIVLGELRIEIGRLSIQEIIARLKSELMQDVTARTAKAAKVFGLKIVDVRVERIDLLPENEQAVFESMRSEREKQTRKILAEGNRRASDIRAEADREKTVILAEAGKKAQEIRGRADAQAAAIYAAAFGKDIDFYRFTKTLELYRKTVNEKSTLFLNRDDELMKLMGGMGMD